MVLEHAHRHAHGARAVARKIRAGDDLRQVVLDGGADFLVVTQPVARPARKQVVPLRGAGWRITLAAARVHGLHVLHF
jgi:hypothetical protein